MHKKYPFDGATKYFLLLLYAVLPLFAATQIEQKGTPIAVDPSTFRAQPFYMEVDFNRDFISNSKSTLPLIAGYTVPVNINTSNAGEWFLTENEEYQIWIHSIKASQLVGIAFYFDHFDLPEGARFYVYSQEQKQVIGAFTNNSKGVSPNFSTQPVFAEELLLQLELPIRNDAFGFDIGEIGLVIPNNDFKSGFGASGSCNVNVNCSEGQAWQQQKNGISRLLVKQGSSLFWCSGSLVNNTRNDGTPYLLTAKHCGPTASEADFNQWIFYFNYEAANCENPLIEPQTNTLTGAQLRAKSPGSPSNFSDFMLLELNQEIPSLYTPYFNGWSRENTVGTNGVGMHHPSGDIKKISTYKSMPLSSGFGTGILGPEQLYWQVFWSATDNGHGVTEGGSSGSPLFDNQGRIVGALTGGAASCADPNAPDFYGKFSYSWESNGESIDQQLKPWLDPDNTGLMQLNGFGSDTNLVFAGFEADARLLLLNESVNFEQLSSGIINTYDWYFEGGEPSRSNEMNPPPIRYPAFGSFDVRLIIAGNNSADTLLKKDFIQVKPTLYPNPSKGTFTLNFGREIPEDLQISVFDLTGREVDFYGQNHGHTVSVSLKYANHGVFLVRVKDALNTRTMKLFLIQ
jgi:hypothetical protein